MQAELEKRFPGKENQHLREEVLIAQLEVLVSAWRYTPRIIKEDRAKVLRSLFRPDVELAAMQDGLNVLYERWWDLTKQLVSFFEEVQPQDDEGTRGGERSVHWISKAWLGQKEQLKAVKRILSDFDDKFQQAETFWNNRVQGAEKKLEDAQSALKSAVDADEVKVVLASSKEDLAFVKGMLTSDGLVLKEDFQIRDSAAVPKGHSLVCSQGAVADHFKTTKLPTIHAKLTEMYKGGELRLLFSSGGYGVQQEDATKAIKELEKLMDMAKTAGQAFPNSVKLVLDSLSERLYKGQLQVRDQEAKRNLRVQEQELQETMRVANNRLTAVEMKKNKVEEQNKMLQQEKVTLQLDKQGVEDELLTVMDLKVHVDAEKAELLEKTGQLELDFQQLQAQKNELDQQKQQMAEALEHVNGFLMGRQQTLERKTTHGTDTSVVEAPEEGEAEEQEDERTLLKKMQGMQLPSKAISDVDCHASLPVEEVSQWPCLHTSGSMDLMRLVSDMPVQEDSVRPRTAETIRADLSATALGAMIELIKLNEKIAMLHYGKDVDKGEARLAMALGMSVLQAVRSHGTQRTSLSVRDKYRNHFREHLDPDGKPVSYDRRSIFLERQIMKHILQWIAEAESARAAFFCNSMSSESDFEFLKHLSFRESTVFGAGAPSTAGTVPRSGLAGGSVGGVNSSFAKSAAKSGYPTASTTRVSMSGSSCPVAAPCGLDVTPRWPSDAAEMSFGRQSVVLGHAWLESWQLKPKPMPTTSEGNDASDGESFYSARSTCSKDLDASQECHQPATEDDLDSFFSAFTTCCASRPDENFAKEAQGPPSSFLEDKGLAELHKIWLQRIRPDFMPEIEHDPYLTPPDARVMLLRFLRAERNQKSADPVASAAARLRETAVFRRDYRCVDFHREGMARRLLMHASNPGPNVLTNFDNFSLNSTGRGASAYFADYGLRDCDGEPVLVGRSSLMMDSKATGRKAADKMIPPTHLRAVVFVCERAACETQHEGSYILDLSSYPDKEMAKHSHSRFWDADGIVDESESINQHRTKCWDSPSVGPHFPSHVSMEGGLPVLKEALRMMTTYYPGLLKRVYFYRPGFLFRALFNIFSMWVPPDTRAKFVMVAKGEEHLHFLAPGECSPARVPPELGGRGPPLDGDRFLGAAVKRY
ncbi:unnamed protein product, partial [Polarella glacialis]